MWDWDMNTSPERDPSLPSNIPMIVYMDNWAVDLDFMAAKNPLPPLLI